ncbi:hypothetical protein [Luteimonas sp. FCS-9]|uniref:hypothetical protein n=1 Tax=Luteimonas sp. FCS-9 TaxID=1547516 RepID=UPI00063ECF68|nr:hypothetical protein [Luteimonas sp. FCS-9]KLI97367.1 hypothetical protein WQ56_17130 [Luteimonas sp. FCS-9]
MPPTPPLPPDVETRQAAWLHDLRNAANSVGIALEAVGLLLQHDDPAGAARNLARAQQDCERILQLVRAPARGDGLD